MTESKSDNSTVPKPPADSDAKESLQGWIPDLEDKKALCGALDDAFTYRGDVTLTLSDDRQIQGFIYDRRPGEDLEHSFVRIMLTDGGQKTEVAYSEIARLQFTGKDPAHGKTWESWLVRWATKKADGESANLFSESLDEVEDKS